MYGERRFESFKKIGLQRTEKSTALVKRRILHQFIFWESKKRRHWSL